MANDALRADAGGTVLLTGATGFLGGAVAAELLEAANDSELLFLVRARDGRTAVDRLLCSIERFGIGAKARARVTDRAVLCGDLAKFETLLADARLQRVTHVLNCAAAVSFAWKREVWTTNVEHTSRFARCVAELPALRRVLHVSTAMVSGATTDRTVREDEFPGTARQFTLYTKSKAEVERRLPALLGGALTIARPSIILGHSRLGCAASASIFWLFRMIHAARRVPFPPLSRIDIVPVDYCARALVHLLLKQTLAHSRYHVSAGPGGSCSFAEIDSAYARACGDCAPPDLEQFDIGDLPSLEPHFQNWFGPCDPKQTAGAIRVYRAFAGLNVAFDNARLLQEAMEPPPRFVDYVPACVRTSQSVSIPEQMTSDFR